MAQIIVRCAGGRVSVVEVDPGETFSVEYRNDTDPQLGAPEATVHIVCGDCEEPLTPGDEASVCECAERAADAIVDLCCPQCGGDVAEVNVAEIWSPVLDLTFDAQHNTVLVEVESPVYGDWEGAGWICTNCRAPLRLPQTCETEYR